MTTLITLDEYKEYAVITSIEFDDKLQSIVNRVSDLVKSYCGRKFIDYYNKATQQFQNIVEYSNFDGTYYPKEFPLQSLVSVEYSLDLGETYTLILGCALDKSRDAIYIPDEGREGINMFKITYTGGYQKTPEDLKLACLDLVEYYYKSEAVPRRTTMNNTVEYVTTSDMPSHIKRVLDLYRVLL
jgi:hypothetical protein